MRILILANNDMGLYKFRRELLEALAQEYEVFFCTPEGEFVERLQELGCRYVPCRVLERRGKNPFKDFRLMWFYRSVVSDIRPDAVLTYTIKPNVYGGMVCGWKKVPYIANVTGLGTAVENGGLLSKVSLKLYKMGLKKARCVFFQNEKNRALFEDKHIVSGKTRLLPGSGVSLERYGYAPYPSDAEGIRLLFVGRIMKDKGIEELLNAIHAIRADRPEVTADIVGWCDEDYVSALQSAEAAGDVRYHGMQKDVRPFYRDCHGVVLPSYHEGMANTLLEASATGRPVIASDIPGCRETFDEGITGFGCEARSVASLTDAIRRFAALPQERREAMGKAARAKMKEEYDRRLVIAAYLDEVSHI